jgi:hypothetical protein
VRILLNDSNSESKLVRTCTNQGLPDGIFSNQKIAIWVILEGSCNGRCWYRYTCIIDIWFMLRPFDIFYGHLVYFLVIWYMLWKFGICCGNLAYFYTCW